MLDPASGLSRVLEGDFGPTCVQGAHAPLFPPSRAETGTAMSQEG